MSTKSLFKALLVASLAFSFACADGKNGANGADGMNGADGANGTNGADGMNGADGANGADGMNGMNGADGADGMNGADATCANVPALEITEITGISDTLYDNNTSVATVVTNAAEGANVSLTFAGAGIPATFTDNGDSTFNVEVPYLTSFIEDANAVYSVIATDGCSVATTQLTINNVEKSSAKLRVLNLSGEEIIMWAQTPVEGRDEPELTRVTYSFGLEDMEFDDEFAVRPGTSSFEMFGYSFSSSYSSYDETDLLGAVDFDLTLNMTYVMVITAGAEGPEFALMEMPEVPEGQANMMMTHASSLVGEVDIWEVNSGTALFTDLMPGTSSDVVAVDPMMVKLGADLDNDMNVDATFFPFEAAAGDTFMMFAMDNDAGDGAQIFIAMVDAEGNSGAMISTMIPPVPAPTDVLDGSFVTPYFVQCENDEDASVGSPSMRVFSAPGATSIDFEITSNMEDTFSGDDCYDTLYIYDGEWNEVYAGCQDDDVQMSVSVPGETAIFLVESDGSGLSDYQIDSFTANMP